MRKSSTRCRTNHRQNRREADPFIPEELPVCVDMLAVEVYVSSVFTMLRRRFEDYEDVTLPIAEGRSVLVKLVAVRDAAVFASVGPALPVSFAIEAQFLRPEIDIAIRVERSKVFLEDQDNAWGCDFGHLFQLQWMV